MRTKRGQAAYNSMIKRKNLRIKITVTVFFVIANVIIACIFWPLLKEHRDKIKTGERKPFITIERR